MQQIGFRKDAETVFFVSAHTPFQPTCNNRTQEALSLFRECVLKK